MIKPLNSNILLKEIKEERVGSIIVPADTRFNGRQAKVVAAPIKSIVKKNHVVLIKDHAYITEVSIDDKQYLMCDEKDLLAIVK